MKKASFLSFLLMASMCSAQMTDKEKLDLAASYYDAEEYDKAYPLYLELAENGNSRAQRVIGHYYFWGMGSKDTNYALAYEWYKKAADKEDGGALNAIGYMYDKGLYLTQSKEMAFQYYLQASKQGNAYGSVNVAVMYSMYKEDESFPPIDKTKNYARVPDYYSSVSSSVESKPFNDEIDEGNNSSQRKTRHEHVNEDVNYVQLVLQENGQLNFDVIPTSPEEEWFLLAAKQDSAYGIFRLARYYDWNGCDYDYLTFRFDTNYSERLHSLFSIAADHGSADAMAIVASDYIIRGDYSKALPCLVTAKKQGANPIISRPNVYLSVDAAIAVCKYLVATAEYHLAELGDCMGEGIAADNGRNNTVYVFVTNRQEKSGIVKINLNGQIISKTPIKYDGGYHGLDNDVEWRDDVIYFNGTEL